MDRIDRIAIVGARGQMGTMFHDASRAAGLDVRGLDRPLTDGDAASALADVDLLVLSVPVPAMAGVLDTLLPHLPQQAILTDVGSVKEVPMRLMLEKHSGPVVGTHPLFGPVIPEGFTPRVAVTPGRGDSAVALVSDWVERMGYQPFASSAADHDRAMAFVQGLNFTTTVAYLAAMRDVDGIENFLTPSLARRLEAARKMLTMDKDLFSTISENNPYLQQSVRQFRSYLNVAAGGDLELLADRACWWWRKE